MRSPGPLDDHSFDGRPALVSEASVAQQDLIVRLLKDRPVACRPCLARIAVGEHRLGATAALLLSQLLYWDGKGREDFIYKTADDFEKETGLTRQEQRTAREKLKQARIIHEKLQGTPPKLHFKVDMETLMALLRDQVAVASDRESKQLQLLESTNQFVTPSKSSIAKTTSQTTSEKAASGESSHRSLMAIFSEVHLRLKGEKPQLGAREGKALKELIHSSHSPDVIQAKMEALEKLIRTGDKFWRQKPFVPSTLLSLWNHVQIEKTTIASASADASWESIV